MSSRSHAGLEEIERDFDRPRCRIRILSPPCPRRNARLTEREKLAGRLHAARMNGAAAAVTPRGDGRFTVVGRVGDRYTVKVFDLETMTCDCRAGQFGNACWHAAATYLRLVADRTVAA